MSKSRTDVGSTRRDALHALSGGALLLGAPAIAGGKTKGRLRLWYRQPAKLWTEALPVGNGRSGAMIFGGTAHERIQLNEDTLWGGGPYDPVNPQAKESLPKLRQLIFDGRYAEAEAFANAHVMAKPLSQAFYKSVGNLLIDFDGIDPARVTQYERELDIDSARASTDFHVGRTRHVREVVASPHHQVLAIRLKASSPGALSGRLSLDSPQKQWNVASDGPDTLVLSGKGDPEGEIPGALRFEARLKVVMHGGAMRTDGKSLWLTDADEATLIIAMATSYRNYEDVSANPEAITRQRVADAAALSFNILAASTAVEHRRLFRRVQLDLGSSARSLLPTDARIAADDIKADPALAELYFQYARYLLIACSRPGGQPANLQGLWNESVRPPWGSKYTVNINTEMNYWPAEATALPECVEPLIAMIRELSITGARTAREMYGARGWVCHHNTDLWRATAPIDGAQFGLWPMGGAWLCTHLWSHYDYGRDRAFLASVYPIMRGAALFFLDTLQVDPATGNLVTNPSMSPENNHSHGAALIFGPTMDSDILRDLFDQVGAAARILGEDAAFVGEVEAARKRLMPHRIGGQGQLQEWPFDWDAEAPDIHHRHVSHLYGLFPGNQIDLDRTPALAAAAKRSLDIRGDKATGWATAWRLNLWAKLRDGNRAHSILAFLMGPERTYPNMFDAHPPFQIDGNFGGCAGIAEMLLQGTNEGILLLPALPEAWPNGSVRGLRARGGLVVDIVWRNGHLHEATILGGSGEIDVRYQGGTARVATGATKRVHLDQRAFAVL